MPEEKSQFVYVTYIRTTVDDLWKALTTPEIMKKYWFGIQFTTDWQKGSTWSMAYADGMLMDAGEILDIDPGRRLVFKWRHQFRPELKAEGESICAIELERDGDAVKLTVHHSIEKAQSKLIEAVSGGWPKILSNLKSLLETGEILLD